MQVAQHPEEHLAGQVIGLRCPLGAEVGSHDRGERTEDPVERPGLTPVGRVEDLVELPIEPVSPVRPHGFIPVIAAAASEVAAHDPPARLIPLGLPARPVAAGSTLGRPDAIRTIPIPRRTRIVAS
jgi:hypothetical protein